MSINNLNDFVPLSIAFIVIFYRYCFGISHIVIKIVLLEKGASSAILGGNMSLKWTSHMYKGKRTKTDQALV